MGKRSSLRLVEDDLEQDEGCRRFVGELWTAQQRQMHSLHYVVSYRASFKPELPDFCIRRYSKKGDIVLDPFCGRGTTGLQANILGRIAWSFDVNPLAVRLAQAKTAPIGLDEIVLRLNEVDFRRPVDLTGFQESFAPFYHPDTYRELVNLRGFLKKKRDRINSFIELIALSRLHGHSPGFFSVYSFPQISIPPSNQALINRKRRQIPEYRAVAPRIIKKAAQSLRDGFSSEFFSVSGENRAAVSDARVLKGIPAASVDLIVTSPPFLNKVDYVTDNWLECWFAGINPAEFEENLIMCSSLDEWRRFIGDVMNRFVQILKPGAYAVIEVGEVESGGELTFLDEVVAEEAAKISEDRNALTVKEILVNQQQFTKLANCFKVENNKKGTNTNRLVVMRSTKKPLKTRKG